MIGQGSRISASFRSASYFTGTPTCLNTNCRRSESGGIGQTKGAQLRSFGVALSCLRFNFVERLIFLVATDRGLWRANYLVFRNLHAAIQA